MRLELAGAALRFGDHAPLFKGLDMCVESGQFVVVEGPSGSGKSSLLRLLNRLHEPTAGALLIDGARPRDADVADLRRRAILVPQTPTAMSGTVRDTLCWPLAFRANRHLTRPTDTSLRQRLDAALLQDAGLDDESRTLSVGQRQRLSLLRALLLEPEILLCDEPTAALDGVTRAVIESQLASRAAAGCGVVVVTHQAFDTPPPQTRRLRLQPDGLQEIT